MKQLRYNEITEDGWYFLYRVNKNKVFTNVLMTEDDIDNGWVKIKNFNDIYCAVWMHEDFFNSYPIDIYKDCLFIGPVNIPEINESVKEQFINESIVTEIIE